MLSSDANDGGQKRSSSVGSSDNLSSSDSGVHLQRTLGLLSATSIIVGCVIGSGIFVSPKGVLLESGSVGLSLVVWALCGGFTLLGAHSFAELGTLIPSSGGMYDYIREAFGDLASFAYLWIALLIWFPTSCAVMALTFAENVLQPVFNTCDSPASAQRLLAAAALAMLTYVNCVSVTWASRIQTVFSVIKVATLAAIILTGMAVLFQGNTEHIHNAFQGSTRDGGRIAFAFYSGIFSFSGWYALNFVIEELKHPYINLPRAIWISIPLVTFIYVMTNLAYFAVLTPSEIIQSDAVAVSFVQRQFGWVSLLMPAMVACSTFGSINGSMLCIARMFFVGARQGHLPKVLALIQVHRFTPVAAVLFEGLTGIMYLAFDDVFVLINLMSFAETLVTSVCVAALLCLRYKRPNQHRPIKVQLWIPITFLIVGLLLIIIPIVANPKDMAVGLIICVSALPVYLVAIVWSNKPRSFTRVVATGTRIVQKVFMAVPQEGKVE